MNKIFSIYDYDSKRLLQYDIREGDRNAELL